MAARRPFMSKQMNRWTAKRNKSQTAGIPSAANSNEPKSEKAILARYEQRHSALITATKALGSGQIKSLICMGPPGIGKTYTVTETLSAEGVPFYHAKARCSAR